MVAGVVYDPLRNEMFCAERGAGAALNGMPIHASRTKTLQESLIATGFPSKKRHLSPNVHFYQEFTLRSHGVRRAGAAALDLAYVACGRLDAFWEFGLNPWDMAAGILLVREAGGTCSDMHGAPVDLRGPTILADNTLLHQPMLRTFGEIFAGLVERAVARHQ